MTLVSTASIAPLYFGSYRHVHFHERLRPPTVASIPAASSGRVGAKTGAAFSSTPSGVSSTTRRIPAAQFLRSRIALGRMTWPFVDTVVASLSPRGIGAVSCESKMIVRWCRAPTAQGARSERVRAGRPKRRFSAALCEINSLFVFFQSTRRSSLQNPSPPVLPRPAQPSASEPPDHLTWARDRRHDQEERHCKDNQNRPYDRHPQVPAPHIYVFPL
jgi:hypothetical protein